MESEQSLANEKLIDVCAISNKIVFDGAYKKSGIKGAVDTAYLRESAAQKLCNAAAALPGEMVIKIFDAWRPYEVQLELYRHYFFNISTRAENQNISVASLHKLAQEFVSFPDKGKKFSYVHSSGGAVDLTLMYKNGAPVDMGTDFDDFTPKSHTNFFSPSSVIGKNRQFLKQIMQAQGFTNLESEWWHYDFGDAFWAQNTGNAPVYGSIYELNPDVLKEAE